MSAPCRSRVNCVPAKNGNNNHGVLRLPTTPRTCDTYCPNAALGPFAHAARTPKANAISRTATTRTRGDTTPDYEYAQGPDNCARAVDNKREHLVVRPSVVAVAAAHGASAGDEEVGVSGIRVTPEQLAGLSSRVSSGSASIEGELRALSGSLAPLGSDWAGVAQQRC